MPSQVDELEPETAAEEVEAAATPAGPDTLFAGKLLFWVPVMPLMLLDLWSKAAAFDFLREKAGNRFNLGERYTVFETGWVDFEIVNYLNKGTVWGLFGDMHEPLKYLRLVAVGLILFFVYKTARWQRVMLLALGLILAGALGNLYDNFFHVNDDPHFLGAVRDWIHFHNQSPDPAAFSWNFPAFNVADSCITVGAVTLFILLWRDPKKSAPS